MAARFDKASVSGERECIAAFKRTPEVAQERLGDATDATTYAVLSRARARVRIRSGALKAALDRSYNKKTGIGLVGIRKGAKLIIAGEGGSALHSKGAARYTPGSYGHLVEFGHANAAAHPYMIPAAEAERDPYLGRCREAGKAIERDMAAVGGSFT